MLWRCWGRSSCSSGTGKPDTYPQFSPGLSCVPRHTLLEMTLLLLWVTIVLKCYPVWQSDGRQESLGRHRIAKTTVCGVPTMLLPLGCFLYKSSVSSNPLHCEAVLESQIYRWGQKLKRTQKFCTVTQLYWVNELWHQPRFIWFLLYSPLYPYWEPIVYSQYLLKRVG